MFYRTGALTPIFFNTMDLCVNTFPETAHFVKTLWSLGCVLASIAYGVLLVLAYSCFQTLRVIKHGNLYVKKSPAATNSSIGQK